MTITGRNQADQDGLSGPLELGENGQAVEGGGSRVAQPPRSAAGPRRKPPKVRGIFERPKSSGIWWIRYSDAGGREHREKAGTRGMAMALLEKRRMERRQGKKLPETLRRRQVPVGELLELAAAQVRSRYAQVRGSHRGGVPIDSRLRTLKAEFGSLDAAALTPQRIEQVLEKIAAEREWRPATVNRHQDFLSLAFKLGLRNGLVTANPARLIQRRREDNGRIRFLLPAEEARLRAAIRADFPEFEPELDLALYTGLRQANQYALKWADVHFERRQIEVARAKNGRPFYAPINTAALAALLKLRGMAGDDGHVILNRNRKGRGVGQARRDPRSWFEAAVERAGLKGVCWHTLRHTFASRAVMAGVDIRTVAELLGHRTLAMAMRYSHLAPQHQLAASERVVAFAAIQSGTRTGTGPYLESEGDAAAGAQPIAVQ
ncbi:MAG TPA: site-specific integrase [Terriglobales bacterium]|nr:site-specific integrase [Terriglobales bacterium]